MPRDSNGSTQPLPGTIVSTGDTVLPSQHNPALVDLYAMMTQSLSRDGQGGMRANLDLSTFKAINLAAGTAAGDAVNKGQLDGAVYFPSVSSFVFDVGNLMVQFGSSVINTDPSGQGVVNFPVPFSQAPWSIIVCSGSSGAFAGHISVNASYTASLFGISTNGLAPSQVIQVNWVAIGVRT